MTRIPPSEWSAIAARYSKGESISSIARHYGCTPPAIHYILKRIRARTTAAETSPAPDRTSAKEAAPSHESANVETGQSACSLAREASVDQVKPLPLRYRGPENGERHPVPTAGPAQAGQSPMPRMPARAGRAPALAAELDPELQAYAEAVTQAFRASLVAALAEGSPATREGLRQAACDLMRAAARTIIVLDRLDARNKRTRFV